MGLSFTQVGFLHRLDIGNTDSFSHAFYYFHLLIFYFMHKGVLSACVSLCHVCAWCSWRSEVDIRSPGTEVMDSCEPLYGYWKLNPGSWQEQVLLAGEPSHQPQLAFTNCSRGEVWLCFPAWSQTQMGSSVLTAWVPDAAPWSVLTAWVPDAAPDRQHIPWSWFPAFTLCEFWASNSGYQACVARVLALWS